MINKLAGLVRRCIDDYGMIEQGETIAVGVSGGKDSMVLLCALASLSKYHPKNFKVHAVTLDMGMEIIGREEIKKRDGSPVSAVAEGVLAPNFSSERVLSPYIPKNPQQAPIPYQLTNTVAPSAFIPIAELCEKLGVGFTLKRSEIASIVFEHRKEKNPCSLCATMRRAALCKMVRDLGISKIALAHHYDDAIETFLLSLLYEGRISCFQPVTFLDRTEVTQIRPMLYVEEKAIINFAEIEGISIVKNPCPINGVSKREEVKTLIKTLGIDHKDLKTKLFGAIQRLPLEGWRKEEE